MLFHLRNLVLSLAGACLTVVLIMMFDRLGAPELFELVLLVVTGACVLLGMHWFVLLLCGDPARPHRAARWQRYLLICTLTGLILPALSLGVGITQGWSLDETGVAMVMFLVAPIAWFAVFFLFGLCGSAAVSAYDERAAHSPAGNKR